MASRTGVGLSEVQLDRLREQIAAGRKPRVRVSGPQFANHPTGTVLAVGTPEADGDDFVTIRVNVRGVTDELRFSPHELTAAATSGRPGRAASRPDRAAVGQQDVEPEESVALRTAASAQTPAATRTTAPTRKVEPAKRTVDANKAAPVKRAAPARGVANDHRAPRTQKAPGPATADVASPRSRGGARAAARLTAGAAGSSRRRGAPLPTVSVTLTSAGAAWFVSAHRGSRAIVKNVPVSPGVVSAIAEILGLAAVGDAVAAVNDVALQEAQGRAAALRAELAALEAEVDSHRRP